MEAQKLISAYPTDRIKSLAKIHRMDLLELMYSYGILRKRSPIEVTNMPISLNPKVISQVDYRELQTNSLAFHRIMELLYDHFEDLLAFYEEYSHGDELVEILFNIYRQAKEQGRDPNKPEVLIIRNDFMFDLGSQTFQQVEFNTMSIGLGQQSSYLQNLIGHIYNSFFKQQINQVPSSNSEWQIETFVRAFELYGNKNAIFLEVMLPDEPNIFDSIHNEKALNRRGIKVWRIRLNQILPENIHYDHVEKKLFVFGEEVAVVYMRSLYDPSHFDDHRISFWVKAELSKAVIIPSIKSFIIGIKLTQHLFSSEKLLDKFNLLDIRKNHFQKHFCETKCIQTDFNNDKDKLLAHLKQNRNSLLLKSFKEGGLGLLLGGDEMIEYAETASLADLQQLLIAHRIDTPFYESLILVDHECKEVSECISEISIFSSFVLRRGESGWKTEWEQVWDYLLRSKYRSEIKGGISVGASFMDTLIFRE